MNIPSSVTKEIKDNANKYDNNYFYHAEEAWNRLTEVYNGNTPYISEDIALLVSMLERYYKSVLWAKILVNPTYQANCDTRSRRSIFHTHNLNILQDEVEKEIAPLFAPMTRSEAWQTKRFFDSLSNKYISTRYESDYAPKSDFDDLYKVAKQQRERIMNMRTHEEYLNKVYAPPTPSYDYPPYDDYGRE